MLGSSVILVLSAQLLIPHAVAQTPTETLLSKENAYNPIPSPDGKYIAYVRTGWGRPGWFRFARTPPGWCTLDHGRDSILVAGGLSLVTDHGHNDGALTAALSPKNLM
jgi:hypothetical protein